MTYNEGNPAAENACLESPLDTELKPSMLMEEMYFECNVKPLFEQVLEEGIERMTNQKGIDEYVSNINKTFDNKSEYPYLNDLGLDT